MIVRWLKDRSAAGRTAEELYGRVVTAARHPRFYADMGVADTAEGRFELVALHLFLAVEAVAADATRAGWDVARRTIEAFVVDMDDCMREMGVGDLTVPKRVKRAAAAFYERAAAYRAALLADDAEAMGRALGHYVYGDRSCERQVRALADYVRSESKGSSWSVPQAGNERLESAR